VSILFVTMYGHNLEEVEEGDEIVVRCDDCGLTYQKEAMFELFRCC